MPLNKSKGNMYPWVTHTHSHLRGRCPHGCSYCYVQAHERRWGTGAFAGPLRLDERELRARYGSGKTVFIEHQNDLFADRVPREYISKVLAHCAAWPDNTYVFQSKNPGRMAACWRVGALPPKRLLGVTIESNRHHKVAMGNAPEPALRYRSCGEFPVDFVTVEPIMDFDVGELVKWLNCIAPRFVNIGADSKGHGLPEPSWEKVQALLGELDGFEIREKHNLERLKGAVHEA